MSSNRANESSIAAKLVWRFALTASLILCAAMGLLYWIVVQHTFEEDNAFLHDKLEAIRAELRAGDQENAMSSSAPRDQGERATYMTRLIDTGGTVLLESPGMRETLPSGVFPRTESLAPTDYRAAGRLFSLLSAIERTPQGAVTIQVAQDRAEDERFMKQFALLCGGVLLCSAIAASLIASRVAKRALLPLEQMTSALQRIKPEHFRERVAPAGWPRELQPMAAAYDAMLARLEHSFAKLSQFSADLAHELRTPIANMRGEGEVALTRTRSADEYRQTIESTVAECAALSAIIDKLLFLARAEAAEATIARSRFEGRAALEKIASYFHSAAEERQITISCSGSGELNCDAVLFRRAVSNLVDNALCCTPLGGAIEITMATRDGTSEVAVRDNGCGMEKQHLPRVFDRFYRIDQSRSSAGTGLGLAIVKSIVELHEGATSIDSDPGRGTIVTLKFPHLPPAVPREKT